jgi:predicted nuclease with TOPRIM domain
MSTEQQTFKELRVEALTHVKGDRAPSVAIPDPLREKLEDAFLREKHPAIYEEKQEFREKEKVVAETLARLEPELARVRDELARLKEEFARLDDEVNGHKNEQQYLQRKMGDFGYLELEKMYKGMIVEEKVTVKRTRVSE